MQPLMKLCYVRRSSVARLMVIVSLCSAVNNVLYNVSINEGLALVKRLIHFAPGLKKTPTPMTLADVRIR